MDTTTEARDLDSDSRNQWPGLGSLSQTPAPLPLPGNWVGGLRSESGAASQQQPHGRSGPSLGQVLQVGGRGRELGKQAGPAGAQTWEGDGAGGRGPGTLVGLEGAGVSAHCRHLLSVTTATEPLATTAHPEGLHLSFLQPSGIPRPPRRCDPHDFTELPALSGDPSPSRPATSSSLSRLCSLQGLCPSPSGPHSWRDLLPASSPSATAAIL